MIGVGNRGSWRAVSVKEVQSNNYDQGCHKEKQIYSSANKRLCSPFQEGDGLVWGRGKHFINLFQKFKVCKRFWRTIGCLKYSIHLSYMHEEKTGTPKRMLSKVNCSDVFIYSLTYDFKFLRRSISGTEATW